MIQYDLIAQLNELGIDALIVESIDDLDSLEPEVTPQVALLDVSSMSRSETRECVESCSHIKLPVIAVVPKAALAALDLTLEISDFVVSPPDFDELSTRIKRIMQESRPHEESSDVVRMGDLAVNPTTYEVTLKSKRVNLRFKEYELLRLLITNPGRVYTREALLSSIWGYDYLGGTRTVDVHIRRLRSKIEDGEHEFIETIWNVGYRFRDLREAS
jgi:DNA-binding response OmpR family regulator